MFFLLNFVAFDGCTSEIDNIWSIQWPNTQRGTTIAESCPGGETVLGMYILIISLYYPVLSVCVFGNV